MAGRNKVDIIGHLGNDPEIKYMASGDAVCNISLATSESWKDKTTGEKKEVTEWHRVVFFGKVAEIAGEYLRKGSQCAIIGKLKTRKWQKDGVDHYTTEIVVDSFSGELLLLGSPSGDRQAPRNDNTQQQRPQQQSRPAQQQQSRPQQSAPQPQPDFDSFDDDIPF